MMDSIIAALSAGGDASMIAFAFLVWRLDRRLLVLEVSMRQLVRRLDYHNPGEIKDAN